MKKTALPRKVPVSSLKEHPRQQEFFFETSDLELRELADDMQQRGQQEPIHCCTDGTIIRGHRRVQAAKLLGWTEIDAIVRKEFNTADDPDVVEELINDNLKRRQLDDLTLARCYQFLKVSLEDQEFDEQGDMRDILAARLNCGKSGRSLDRLERLLDLPKALQDAISRGSLKKAHGEKILRFRKERQEEIAVAIQRQDRISEVLTEYGLTERRKEKSKQELAKDLLEALRKTIPQIASKINSLDRVQVGGDKALEVLDQAVEFLSTWRDRKRKLFQKSLVGLMPRLTKSAEKNT